MNWRKTFFRLSLLLCAVSISMQSCRTGSTGETTGEDILRADSLLMNILKQYSVPAYGLLQETYPVNPDNKVTYLSEGSEQQKEQEVSYLWPYSGMLSGVIALYKETGDRKYLDILENQIIPGLQLYWDPRRTPACYQSYPLFNGESDRFYDDNDWIAIDFADLYGLTKNKNYLDLAEQLHTYIYSGWDDLAGGGIYWCEQKKTSKNTCSNAPAAVLCMKLYAHTKDADYLELAKKTYSWTRDNLRDPADYVYWDNIHLDGQVDKAKYTYNSGQMIQAAVLLYEATGENSYLQEAGQTAKGSFDYFVKPRQTVSGEEAPFFPASAWFNVILSRGYMALYDVDGNDRYIKQMADNARYAWEYTRDENGFLGHDWAGTGNSKYKWLLDNASMIELYTEINHIK